MLSRLVVSDYDRMDYSLPGSSVRGDSPEKNTGVGCRALGLPIPPLGITLYMYIFKICLKIEL